MLRSFSDPPVLSSFLRTTVAANPLLLAFALLFAPGFAAAEPQQTSNCPDLATEVENIVKQPALYNLRVENDMFNGTDSQYTSGVSLSWVSANLQNYFNDPCLPHWARQFNKMFDSAQPSPGTSRNMVITAGQLMYTPADRKRTDLIRNDRPYAAWLYLGMGYNARNGPRMDSVEINLGMVGPAALGRQAQNLIHDTRGIPRFNGWSNQIRNEPGIQVVSERKKRWEYTQERNGVDAIVHYGASLGNVKTHVNSGLTLRAGRIPDDFGTSPIRPGGDCNAPTEGNFSRHFTHGGLHAFASLDARLVARDIFLDGNTFVDGPRVEKRRFVGDFASGIAWQWAGGKLAFARYVRSKEFSAQLNSHAYSSLTLSLEF